MHSIIFIGGILSIFGWSTLGTLLIRNPLTKKKVKGIKLKSENLG
jgi:hypothetical protein